jgi:parallel beta-helix repeat protein
MTAHIRLGTLALATGLVAAVPSGARAQVACGDVIAKGQTVTLTADLGPCDGVESAIHVEGILDLGGHTVTCADTNGDGDVPYGIDLRNARTQVRNGIVTGCYDGVWVGGSGRHTVEGVTATAAVRYGFYVASSSAKNRLSGNTARASGDDGFQTWGTSNAIARNVAENNGGDGIDVTRTTKNKVTDNTATNNAESGIEVTGTRNKVTGNTATANAAFGIAVGDAKNKVIGNTATGNATADIIGEAPCTNNKFKKNAFGTGSSCVQ